VLRVINEGEEPLGLLAVRGCLRLLQVDCLLKGVDLCREGGELLLEGNVRVLNLPPHLVLHV
jgi:hypothetical protein